MSRGRKKTTNNLTEWQGVFFKSVGHYIQFINSHLKEDYDPEALSKHIRIVGGYSFKSTEYKKSGIPIVRISDFSNEKINLDNPVFYEETLGLEKFLLKPGDILIALTGGTIAKLGIVQEGLGKLYLNQRVGKFEVINPDEFEQEYVYWIARSVQSIIKELAWGAAIPNVSPKDIEQLKFSIPIKRVQRGIIRFLNDLKNEAVDQSAQYFNKAVEEVIIAVQESQIIGNNLTIELSHQLNLLKQLRQAFLREAMQGKLVKQEPKDGNAADLLQQIKAEKAETGKKEKPLPPIKDEEIPFAIPDNWVWCRLGEIVDFISGNNFNSTDFKKGDGIKCIKITNAGVGEVIETDDVLPHYFISRFKSFLVFEGDLILALTRPYIANGLKISKCPRSYNNSLLNQRVAVIRTKLNLPSEYVYQYFRSNYVLQLYKSKFDYKGQQPNLKKEDVTELLFPLPPLAEQHRIVKKLESLMEYCDALQQSIQQSRQQTEKLLQQVLREALRQEERSETVE